MDSSSGEGLVSNRSSTLPAKDGEALVLAYNSRVSSYADNIILLSYCLDVPMLLWRQSMGFLWCLHCNDAPLWRISCTVILGQSLHRRELCWDVSLH